jgi:cysteine-rich repeat protein
MLKRALIFGLFAVISASGCENDDDGESKSSGGTAGHGGKDGGSAALAGGGRTGGSTSRGGSGGAVDPNGSGGAPDGGIDGGGTTGGDEASGGSGGVLERGGAGGHLTGGVGAHDTGGRATGGHETGGASGGIGGGGTAGAGGTLSGGGVAGTQSSGGTGGIVGTGGAVEGESGGSGGDIGMGGATNPGGNEGGAGGESGAGGDDNAARWLGPCAPLDISDDARTVLAHEGLWTRAGGWEVLPDLPGGDESNVPLALSRDGHVVFGISGSALGNELYRWTRETGTVGLGITYLPNKALATNADGTVLAGWIGQYLLPFRWTLAGGLVELPIDVTAVDGSESPDYVSLSNDGKTALYDSAYEFSEGPFIWKQESGWLNEFNFQPSFGSALAGSGLRVSSYDTPPISLHGFRCLLSDWPSPELACQAPGAWYSLITGAYETSVVGAVLRSSFDGDAAVGTQLSWAEPSAVSTFYWSETDNSALVGDALAQHGSFLDVQPKAPAALTGDGSTLLSVATRRDAGTAHDECVIGKVRRSDEPVMPSAPSPVPSGCGNGQLASDEACDDGDANNADGCNSRCQRPALALGGAFSCALQESGAVKCWGAGANGQLGNGSTQDQLSPVSVTGVSSAIQLAAGDTHACALLADGTVKCWGAGGQGQLGLGSLADHSTAMAVASLSGITQIAAGENETCALTGAGNVWCWGSGIGTPTEIPDLDDVVQVATGGDRLSCALLAGGAVQCWGNEWEGSPPPALAEAAIQISVGQRHGCALLASGNVSCWITYDDYEASQCTDTPSVCPGQGFFPYFGSCAMQQGQAYDPAPSSAPIVQLVSGRHHNCVLHADGKVVCWGAGSYGQLAAVHADRFSALRDRYPGLPEFVSPLSGAVQLSGGANHNCAVLDDGHVRCWGSNGRGELGSGIALCNGPRGFAVPVEVQGLLP